MSLDIDPKMALQAREKEVIFDLIEMYKHMPFLWNKNHLDYKNKVRRQHANQLLLEVYQKIDETATRQSVNKKIQNLRTSYYKELRKVKEASELNEPPYEPTLWYYEALTFLGDKSSTDCCHSNDPLKQEKVTPSNSDEEESYQNSDTQSNSSTQKRKIIIPIGYENVFKNQKKSPSISDGESSYQNSEPYNAPPPRKRKFTNPITHVQENPTNNKNTSQDTTAVMKDEEWEVFGKAIGLQLRDLDKKQLTIAQKMISDAIYYAKFGLLSPQSYINLGNPLT